MKKIISFFCIFILLLSTVFSAAALEMQPKTPLRLQQNLGQNKLVLDLSDSSDVDAPKFDVYKKNLEINTPQIGLSSGKTLKAGSQHGLAQPVDLTFTQKDVTSPTVINRPFTVTLTAFDPDYNIDALSLGESPYTNQDYRFQSCEEASNTCTKTWEITEEQPGTYHYRIKARNSVDQILSDVLTVTVTDHTETSDFLFRTYAIDAGTFNENGDMEVIEHLTVEIENQNTGEKLAEQEDVTYATFTLDSNGAFVLNYSAPDYEADPDWIFLDSRLPSCSGNDCELTNGLYTTKCNFNYARNAYVCTLTKENEGGPVKFEFTPFADSLGTYVVRYINPMFKSNSPKISSFPTVSFNEGTTYTGLDLDDFVSDPDNSASELNWAASGQTHVHVGIDNNHQITLTPLSSNYVGNDKVTFTVTDPDGNSDSEVLNVEITDAGNDPPVIATKFPDASEVTVPEGTEQSFYIIAEDSDDLQLTFSWEMNGLQLLGEDDNSHNYTAGNGPGNDLLKVTVSDGKSLTSAEWNITIEDTHPTVDFNHTPEYVVANVTEVQFTSIVDSPDMPNGITYEWQFGDGETSAEANPLYTFEEARNYEVLLRVWDTDDTLPTTIKKLIAVNANDVIPTVTDLNITPESVTQGQTISVSVNVTDDIAVGLVQARITTPNGDVTDYDMTGLNDIYTLDFTDSFQIGTYDLQIIANDTFGNVNDQVTGTFEVTKDPTVGDSQTTITAPLDNFEVNLSSSFELNATAKALNAGIQDCEMLLTYDDTVFSLTQGNDPEAIGSLVQDQEALASWTLSTTNEKKDGIYEVTVTTQCLTGSHSSDVVTVVVLPDETKPEVTNLVVSPYLIQPGEQESFSVTATDNVGLLDVKFEVSWNNGTDDFTEEVVSTPDPVEPDRFNAVFDMTTDEAYYTVKALVLDTSGNLNDELTAQFVVASVSSFGDSTTEIVLPEENSTYDEAAEFAVSVKSGATNGDLYNCRVALSFTDQDPVNDLLSSTEPEKPIGDLVNGTDVNTNFVVNADYFGTATITADTICEHGLDSQHSIDVVLNEVIDRQGPNITINSPLNGATYNTESILVDVTVEDPSGVEQITYSVDNGAVVEYTVPVAVDFADGQQHTLDVATADTLGNLNTAQSVFNVDTSGPFIPPDTEPVVALVSDVTEGDISMDVVFTCSVEEGNKPYVFSMSFDDGSPSEAQPATDETSATFTHNYRGGPTHQASFTANCVVTDNDGDLGNAELELNLTPDDIVPEITNVVAPTEVEIGDNFTISATITDNDQVNETTITFGGVDGTVVKVGDVYTAEFDSNDFGLGPKTFTITALDMDQNAAVPESGIVDIVDTGRPTITVISPEEKEYNTLDIMLNVTFEDSDGLALTQWALDAGAYQDYTDPVDLSTLLTLNQEFTIHLFAQDATGNVQRKDVTFSVFDREDPEIVFVDMISESRGTSQLFEVVKGDDLIFDVKAKDDLGIAEANITIDGTEQELLAIAPLALYDFEETNHIFQSIATTGTLSTIDGVTETQNVNLGFNFELFGIPGNSMTISEDGNLGVAGDNNVIPGVTTIAPFWDDFDLTQGGEIYYETQGAAPDRTFIVEWNNVVHADTAGAVTFQAILYETTNEIVFAYDDVSFGNVDYDKGKSATVGVSFDFYGERYSFNQNTLEKGLALKFTPTIASDTYGVWFYSAPADFDAGNVPYSVELIDTNGNAVTQSGTFTVFGNEDPVIEAVSATPDTVVQGDNIVLASTITDDHGIDQDLSLFEVRDDATSTLVDSKMLSEVTKNGNDYSYAVDTVDYVAQAGLGDYTLTVTAVDVDGNTVQDSVGFFIRDIPDTTKPVIVLNAPQPASPVAISTVVRLSAEVTDNDLDANTVLITVDGNTFPTTNTVGDTFYYDYTTDTAGTITYEFNAQDRTGNQADPVSDTIDVYGLGNPVIESISTEPGAAVLGANIVLKATITDDHGLDFDTSLFQVYDVATSTLQHEELLRDVEVTLNGDDYSYSLDTATLAGLGEYTFTVTAFDIDGNSATDSVNFFVLAAPDTQAPVIVLNAHSPDPVFFGDTVTVSADITDNEGIDPATVIVTVDGVDYLAVNTAGDTYEYDWNANKEGTIDYTFNAADFSGNTATPQSSNFDVLPVPTIIDSTIYGGYYANNLATDVTETTVTNSWVIHSTVQGTPVSTIEDSNLTYAILTDVAPIRNCVIIGTAANPSTMDGGSCVDVFIDPSNITNSQTEGASIRNSVVADSDVTNSDVTDSTITDSTFINSTSTSSTVENSTLDGYTVTNAVVQDDTILSGTISDGTTTYDADANGPATLTDIFNFAPTAAFTADKTTGTRPLTVNFDASTSTDPNIGGLLGDSLTYSWDFKDGNTDTGAIVANTFTKAGNYDVELIVTDSFGLTDTETLRITVKNPAVNRRYSGGGGGGGGGGGSHVIKDKSLDDIPPEGKIIELTLNDRLNYEKAGKKYSLLVTSVALSGFTKMRSFPSPGTDYQWGLMEKKSIDMDKDGNADFSFQLQNVMLRKATFFVRDLNAKSITEPTTEEPSAFDEKVNDMLESGELEVDEEPMLGDTKEGVLDIMGSVVPDKRASPITGSVISLAIIFGGLGLFVLFRKVF